MELKPATRRAVSDRPKPLYSLLRTRLLGLTPDTMKCKLYCGHVIFLFFWL
jgi:hypothetical protein